MPANGYLRRVLADGARPFRYRGGVRALLGEPDSPGLLRATPPAPQPQFSYPRPAWVGEIELPGAFPSLGAGVPDWPARHDRLRGAEDRGTAAGGMSTGTPDELPQAGTGHPPAFSRPAVIAEQAPPAGAAGRPSAVTEAGRAAVPAPARRAPTGLPRTAQPSSTGPARQMAAEATQTLAAGPGGPLEPRADRETEAGRGAGGPMTATARPGPEPAAPAGGSREMAIPGRTVRPPVSTGPEQIDVGPDPSSLARQVNTGQPPGPLRRSGPEPAGISGRESAVADSSGELSTPGPGRAGRTVRRIPPRQMSAAAPEEDAGALILGGQATALRVRHPAGPGRQADIQPAGQADNFLPRRPASEAGSRGRAEPPPAPVPVPAPQLIVMLPPRPPAARPAFWERRHLSRLWSRPLR